MRLKRYAICVLILGATIAVDAQSPLGTLGVAWDAITPTPASYRVCIGTQAGSYPSCDSVAGTQTSHTFGALADCRAYYVAVKAVDADGDESESWSNEVVGWPRPRIDTIAPSSVERGGMVEVSISGANFSQDAAVSVTWNGLTATTVSVDSCNLMRARFNTVSTAQIGQPEVVVKIGPPDGAGKRVAGSAAGKFLVKEKVRPGVVPNAKRIDVM